MAGSSPVALPIAEAPATDPHAAAIAVAARAIRLLVRTAPS
jgi:hypothetical protein